MPWYNGIFKSILELINPADVNDDTNDIVGGLNNCLTKDGQNKTDVDFDFNNHKGINVADGTALQDTVNFKQLKQTGNYYLATRVDDSTVSINIAPLTELKSGFTCHIGFNTPLPVGSLTIRVLTGQVQIANVRVLDKSLRALQAGDLGTTASIRSFQYTNGLNPPAFVLDNREITPNDFALPNLSNVSGNARYVNRIYYYAGDYYDRRCSFVFNNENICVQSGTYDMEDIKDLYVDLEYPMYDTYFYASATFRPHSAAVADRMLEANTKLVVWNDTNSRIHIRASAKLASYYGQISWFVMGKAAVK